MYENEITPYINTYLETVDKSKIKDILKYSLEGGKCIRGFLVKHIIETLNPNNLHYEPITAVELIHAASLVIDDLPCMDNDEMRRGKPSTFKVFGEHESILIGLFMVSESLRILTYRMYQMEDNPDFKCKIAGKLIDYWCNLLGKNLIVGQMMDLKGDVNLFSLSTEKKGELKNNFSEHLMKYKTASLFSFCFIAGAAFSTTSETEYNLDEFNQMGNDFGMMFQLMDDNKDKTTDDPIVNYILAKGKSKAIEKYNEHRSSLLFLLVKNKLYTEQFKQLIQKIDTAFLS